MSQRIVDALEGLDAEGLIPTERLKETLIGKDLSAYDATDDQFVKWIIRQMGGLNVMNRLRFRLVCVAILEDLKASPATHWKGRL